MSSISIPHICPLHLILVDPVEIPQYQSRHMEDYWLEERLNKWQSLPGDRWYQLWQQNDTISLQFQNNMGSITVQFINCQKQVLQSVLMTQKQQNSYELSTYIYESSTALTGLPEGFTWALVKVGTSPVKKTFISEPFLVLEDHPNTLLIEFENFKFYEGVIFETGYTGYIRFNGILRKKPTATKDTVYEDQDLDMVMVHSKPYRIWELLIGTEDGVPDWFEDKIGRILGCSDLKIDGRYYTKNEGAKLEEMDERFNGVLYTYKIELREKINRHSRTFDTILTDTNEEMLITLNSTSKGFSDTNDPGQEVVVFYDVE